MRRVAVCFRLPEYKTSAINKAAGDFFDFAV